MRSPTISLTLKRLFMIISFLLLDMFLFKIARQHYGSFGCFDDCFNFMGAFFMLKGKVLYSQIFFNHQMGMAYISYLIQRFAHIHSLYQLVETHRIVVAIFGLCMDIMLIIRFGLVGFGFAVLFESTKYYLFGDRFLAEAMIPYPIIYLFGINFYSFTKKPLHTFDFVISAVFTWFVIFMREPYIPLAIVLYGISIWQKKITKPIIVSVTFFLILLLLIIVTVPIRDYYFNVFTVNQQSQLISGDYSLLGIFKIFFYPIYILLTGTSSFFRSIEIVISIVFTSSIILLLYLFKLKKIVILSLITLALANLRLVEPGLQYYAAFHLIIWYSLFIFITLLFLDELFLRKNYWFSYLGSAFLALLFIYALIAPNSYIREKINSSQDFTTNYANIFAYGKVIQYLSTPTDTLFLDGSDDMIYWQANRISPYKYAWYTSQMPKFSVYTDARMTMFQKTPPDFYYGQCTSNTDTHYMLPPFIKAQYQHTYFAHKPTCLYIRSKKIASITPTQWQSVKSFGFSLQQ